MSSYDAPMGAATFHPDTVLAALRNVECRVAFLQPCRRPQDARGGQNPDRLHKFHQYQVIIMPPPADIQKLVIHSLYECGVDPGKHSIDFVENNWQSPSMGAGGKGYEVLCNGTEVLQFTYFQQLAGKELDLVPIEIAYGVERLCMVNQSKDHVYDLIWDVVSGKEILYGEVHATFETEISKAAYPAESLKLLFNAYENICLELSKSDEVIPAYEAFINLSHIFNLIECNGTVGVNERVTLLGRTRKCANSCLAKFVGGNLVN